MRQVVGFGDRSTERGTFGANLGHAIVTNGVFTAYVCDSAATRPSSQITLGRLVFNYYNFLLHYRSGRNSREVLFDPSLAVLLITNLCRRMDLLVEQVASGLLLMSQCMTGRLFSRIGPATQDVDMLEKMMKSGMSIIRMNFSHGSYEVCLCKI